MITPHLAAPGVNVKVPLVRGGFGTRSGTSISAAQTAGIAALLFEWAIIRDNQPFFTGSGVKYYLQRGARREENMQYPNPEWGYGEDVIIRLQSNKASKINGFRTFFLSRNQTFLLGF